MNKHKNKNYGERTQGLEPDDEQKRRWYHWRTDWDEESRLKNRTSNPTKEQAAVLKRERKKAIRVTNAGRTALRHQ